MRIARYCSSAVDGLAPAQMGGYWARLGTGQTWHKSSRALNFAAALAGLIAAWRWYQPTMIKPPTELGLGGQTVDTGPLVAFVKEIGWLNRRAASWTAIAASLKGRRTELGWIHPRRGWPSRSEEHGSRCSSGCTQPSDMHKQRPLAALLDAASCHGQ
jgi:hypothetical protein